MKNPLVVYTGAALASLAALAGVSMTNWSSGSPNDQKAPEIVGEVLPQASQETAKTPEKPAETTDLKVLEKPADTAQVKAPEPAKAETKTETEVKPELDTVRVESDGQAVVAGRAKPGAEIALKLGDEVIGKGIANADGSWVVVPDSPLPKGAHEIVIEQKAADSAPVTAEQSIAVAIPETAGQQAMVALSKPGAATKVLQAGDSQQQAEGSSGTAEPVTPEQSTAAAKPAETAAKPAEMAEATQTPPEPQQTAETVQEPAAAEPGAETVQKPAEVQQTAEAAQEPAAAETTEPAGQAKKPAGETVAKTEELPTAVKPAEIAQADPKPAKTAKIVALRLDAVDYNDKGDIIFSGRAAPGTAIRLYVDNGRVGDTIVDKTGNWSFSGSDIIEPGNHTLRADQINKGGKVTARIELPFQREDAAAVAALNAPPATKTPQAQTPAKAEVKQPQTTAEVEKPAATEAQPPQTTEQPQTAEVQLPQTTEVAKTEPQASGPAPDQPVAEDKKEEVTTAAAAAAEQTAKTTEPDKPRSGKVVIQPGNNLWKLSRVIYGRGKSYTVIYKANRDQIRNPNRIYPGQIFAIPDANPPESIDPKRKDPLTSAEGGAAQ